MHVILSHLSHARTHARTHTQTQHSEYYQSSVNQAMSTRTLQLPVSQGRSLQTTNLAQDLTLCEHVPPFVSGY